MWGKGVGNGVGVGLGIGIELGLGLGLGLGFGLGFGWINPITTTMQLTPCTTFFYHCNYCPCFVFNTTIEIQETLRLQQSAITKNSS